jgi:uncharacterized protein YbjT (DUF2867 family)
LALLARATPMRHLMDVMSGEKRMLLTGATGFVGSAVRPALLAAGWQVRCLSRDANRARKRWPRFEWVEGDVVDETSLTSALTGCQGALYLVHGMGEGDDFAARERQGATAFANAAAAAGCARVVYLGGLQPPPGQEVSAHLRSRREVGEILRAGRVPAIELRASMIVGRNSLSWIVVRDLAARLPFMVLPAWLRSRTQPVAIDDVVVALVRGLSVDLPQDMKTGGWFDIPGPDTLSGKEILDETARALGFSRPVRIEVPVLTPRLSSLWLRFVTRAHWATARQVVLGLTHDLLAHDDRYWSLIDHQQRLSFVEAARRAVVAENDEAPPWGFWAAVERARRPAERRFRA